MATLILGAAGAAIVGAVPGVSTAPFGGVSGSTIGPVADSGIVASFAPTRRIEGARLDALHITSSTIGERWGLPAHCGRSGGCCCRVAAFAQRAFVSPTVDTYARTAHKAAVRFSRLLPVLPCPLAA